jgi:hypothetical protein
VYGPVAHNTTQRSGARQHRLAHRQFGQLGLGNSTLATTGREAYRTLEAFLSLFPGMGPPLEHIQNGVSPREGRGVPLFVCIACSLFIRGSSPLLSPPLPSESMSWASLGVGASARTRRDHSHMGAHG